MIDDDDKVTPLPVKFKAPEPAERSLLAPYEVGKRTCYHDQFVVDATLSTVECAACHEKLDPMWVLAHLCHRDHRFVEAHRRYADEMKRLEERSRTKCDRCGHMTRISWRR